MNPLLLDKINTHPEFHSDQTHQQYTLADVSWSLYEGLLIDFDHNFPGLRVHYLEGKLELTLPSRQAVMLCLTGISKFPLGKNNRG